MLLIKTKLISLVNNAKKMINKYFAGNLAIRAVDAGSCNGCELEIHALTNVFYNIERFWHPFCCITTSR